MPQTLTRNGTKSMDRVRLQSEPVRTSVMAQCVLRLRIVRRPMVVVTIGQNGGGHHEQAPSVPRHSPRSTGTQPTAGHGLLSAEGGGGCGEVWQGPGHVQSVYMDRAMSRGRARTK